MARTTVMMPDETSILSMDTTQLQQLAADAEINFMGDPIVVVRGGLNYNYYPNALPEQILQKHLLTVRALMDGRQFSIPRAELLALLALIEPTVYKPNNLSTSQLALLCGLYFDSAQDPIKTFGELKAAHLEINPQKTLWNPTIVYNNVLAQQFSRPPAPPKQSYKRASLVFLKTVGGAIVQQIFAPTAVVLTNPDAVLSVVLGVANKVGTHYYAVVFYGLFQNISPDYQNDDDFISVLGTNYQIYEVNL